MHLRQFLAFLGMALGTALGAAITTGPTAGADPIDTWPYGGALLDEFSDSDPTNVESYFFGMGTREDQVFDIIHPNDAEFSSHVDTLNIPALLLNRQEEVFDLTSGGPLPSVGTVSDLYETFYVPNGIGTESPMFVNEYLNDPMVGTAVATTLFNALQNVYVSDAAGIQDVVALGAFHFTLFEFPAPEAAAEGIFGAGAASDLGDGLQQLLTELGTLF